MVRQSNVRWIGGESFTLVGAWSNKKSAQEQANKIRHDRRTNVRIIKSSSHGFTRYGVYEGSKNRRR